MTRTSLAISEQAGFPEAGTELTFAAADTANGNRFVASGGEVVFARNTGASPHTVTFSYHRRGQLVTQTAVSIPAGKTMMFGPFVEEMTSHDPVDAGQVYVLASHVDIELAVRRQLIGYVAPSVAPTDYIGFWRFDDGSGTPADSSSFGHAFEAPDGTRFTWGTDDEVGPCLVAEAVNGLNLSDDLTPSATVQTLLTDAGLSSDPDGFSVSLWYRRISLFSFFQNGVTMTNLDSSSFEGIDWYIRPNIASSINGPHFGDKRVTDGPTGDGGYFIVGDEGRDFVLTEVADGAAPASHAQLGWKHVVVAWSKADEEASFYLDGALVGTCSYAGFSGAIFAGDDHFAFYATDQKQAHHRDLKLYGRTLTADEALALYAEGIS